MNGKNIETLFKVVEPITEIKDGFGYLGVLLRDTDEDKLQCHICGNWYKSLSAHIQMGHKMGTRKYKKEFGLPLAFPMVSLSISAAHHKRAILPENLNRLAKARDPKLIAKKHPSTKRKKVTKYSRNCMAFKNKNGLCEEQMERRFVIVAEIIGREPTLPDLIKYDHSLWGGIRRNYGTINVFRNKHGFKIIPKSKIWDRDKIISRLRQIYEENKAIPTMSYFRNHIPTSPTIIKYFGSYNRALVAAGIIK